MSFLRAYDEFAFSIGSLDIRWYSLFIITGAFFTYLFCKYFARDTNIKKEILINLFFIVLPFGIIGARLWYVLADFSTFIDNPISVFYIWEGGIAIQGGVIGGALAGIFYLKKYQPKVSILLTMDIVLPCVLIAQAVGRWGNFFNQEVYGRLVDADSLKFIPKFIKDNLYVSSSTTQIAQPLFLYESLLNIIGFILIAFVIRKFWVKTRKNGDLGFLYFIWYGTVRCILEPLRNPEFILKIGPMQASVFMSICFIIFGILGIIFIRINKRFIFKKRSESHEIN